MNVTHIPTRATLIERNRTIKREIEEIFADAAHWNSIHPADVPIDPDPGGQLRHAYDAVCYTLEREERRSGRET